MKQVNIQRLAIGSFHRTAIIYDLIHNQFTRFQAPNWPIDCSLVARDDKTDEVVFGNKFRFESGWDFTTSLKIADFTWDGTMDILADHSNWEEKFVILYIWGEEFDKVIKYRGETFGTIFNNNFQDVEIPTSFDVNWDGILDKIKYTTVDTEIHYWKGDWTYYYVPQKVDYNAKFGDFNNDGLIDYALISGSYLEIIYQEAPTIIVNEPVVEEPVVTDPVVIDPMVNDPIVEPTVPVVTDWIPTIEDWAEKVESFDTVIAVTINYIEVSWTKLWINSTTITIILMDYDLKFDD